MKSGIIYWQAGYQVAFKRWNIYAQLRVGDKVLAASFYLNDKDDLLHVAHEVGRMEEFLTTRASALTLESNNG